MTASPRLFLVTESPAPSGVGEHMLTLADGLAGRYDLVIGAPRGSGLLERARARGFPVKAIDPADRADLDRWFARTRPALVHVHAGIGWEGHATSQAAHAADARVIRTEHLPYVLTDDTQRADHRAAALDQRRSDQHDGENEDRRKSERREEHGTDLPTIAGSLARAAVDRWLNKAAASGFLMFRICSKVKP